MSAAPATEAVSSTNHSAAHSSPQPSIENERGAALLAFDAPYLEQKLCKNYLAQSAEEAARLFRELKRYLFLSQLHTAHDIPMFSVRVDEVWHQFVLFTAEYSDFCQRCIGSFLHHVPNEAPEPKDATAPLPELPFVDFRAAYERWFGPLADDWFDDRCLSPTTRLACAEELAPLRVSLEDQRAVLRQDNEPDRVLCRVNGRARAALEFMVEQRLFLIRELPGLASVSESLDLCRPLVRCRVLRLVP
jgi:hypothetical protein